MTYCLNLQCHKPHNPAGNKFCQNCGSKLLLAERYRVLKPLGEGSISRTFLAEDIDQNNRHCVIKQMRGHIQTIGDPLRQEMSRVKALNHHPQIAKLLDYFEQDSRQYLIQEYIEGQNLAKQLEKEGEFEETEIRQILTEVVPVLHFIHSHQIIHRDIKPENLIRRQSNQQLVLVGFGAAKYATQTALAKTGTLIGSAEYAAPEQLMGRAIFASDLYSLGVTCIHLITQIHPFDLFDTVEGKWVWRDYAGNRISVELGQILDKMLQGSLNQRYASAKAIWKDLHPHKPLPLPPIPVCKEEPETYSKSAPNSAGFSEIQAELKSVVLPPLQPKSVAELTQPPEIELIPEPEESTIIEPSPPPPPQWKCRETFIANPKTSCEITAIAFSAKSNILAGSCWDGTIQLWDTQITPFSQKSPLHTLRKNRSGVTSLAISLEGQILVSGNAEGTVMIWHLWQHSPAELRTEIPPRIKQVLAAHTNLVTTVAISPNGQCLATGSRDQTIKVWNLHTGTLLHTLSDHSQRVTSVTFSPDSTLLASAGADCTMKVWNLQTGTLQQSWQDPAGIINAIAISPDQQILVSGSWDRSVKFWQLTTGTLLQTLQHHLLSVTSVAIHPNGKWLATGSADATVKVYSFPAGELLVNLTDHTKGVTAIAWSPTETQLLSGSSDGTVKLWQCI
jgi:serine/threonine protein kinase